MNLNESNQVISVFAGIGGDNITVRNNDITVASLGMNGSYFYTAGEDCVYRGNDIDIHSQYVYGTGLILKNTQNATICLNDFNNVGQAIRVEENCMGTVLTENEFNDHSIGLLMRETGNVQPFLNPQYHYGNRWEGAYLDIGARHEGTSPQLSKFWVNINQGTGGYPGFYPNSGGTSSVFPINNWFETEDETYSGCFVLPIAGGGNGESFMTKII